MNEKDRLDDLLLRWDELYEQGQDVPPEELCQDCPELVAALADEIAGLKRAAWVNTPVKVDVFQPAATFPGNGQSSPSLDNQPQKTLAGRYRLDALIAEGGFGKVWRAFDLELQRPVAVKVPKLERLADPEGFKVEARKVAQLRHNGIVRVYDVDRHEGAYFIVSDFIEGADLGKRLREKAHSVREAVQIVEAVACALHYAHQQEFVHRDIKPANILVDNQGQVFITDFGIAVTEGELRQGTDGSGTPAYMSPEQVGNQCQIDHRTDIYSLGSVLYELLTKRHPFQADTLTDLQDQILHQEPPSPRSINKEVPKEVERICLKCLSKNPPSRYPTAQALADDLSRCLGKRSKVVLIAAIGLLGVGLLIGLLTNPFSHSLPPDLSQDITGTWSGSWEQSNGFTGEGVLAVKEQPDGTIVGWADKDYKIEEGRRVGRDEIRYLCSGKGFSFQVMGKIKDKGRRLLFLYSGSYSEEGKKSTFVGIDRSTRDGTEPDSEPQHVGWSGKWSGKWANSLGQFGDESIILTDPQDGTILGTWGDGFKVKGTKVNDHLVRWEYTYGIKQKKAEVRLHGDILRLTYSVTYPTRPEMEGYRGVIWFIRDDSTFHSEENPKNKPESDVPPPPDLTGTYSCNDEGTYEIRQVGKTVSWVGKSKDDGKEWCNQFRGQIEEQGDSYIIAGEWKDIPPGDNQGSGTLTLAVEGDRLRVVAETGDYNGTLWKRTSENKGVPSAIPQDPTPKTEPIPAPTPEQVNNYPEKYVRKIMVFDNINLLGEAKAFPTHFRFMVKSPSDLIFSTMHSKAQRIVFQTANNGEEVKSFVTKLPKYSESKVRLTCRLDATRENGCFAARIHRFDIVRFDCSQKLTGEVVEDMSAEGINEEPTKYVGKTVVLDGVDLTGVTKKLRVRTALEVKSAEGKLFRTEPTDGQKFLFTIHEQDKVARAYLDSGIKQDQSRPLRITVEMLRLPNGPFRADVKRIDLIVYKSLSE